jgi:hypothetical protein
MKAVWRWLRKWWWTIVAGVAAVGAVLLAIFVATSDDGQPDTPAPKPNLRARAEREAERVRLEGEIEKARITATADARNAELDRIEEVGKDDPKVAREQLSGWLNANL